MRARIVSAEMSSLDQVNMRDVFERRAMVMRTIPQFFRGAFAASGLFSTSAHWVTRQVIRRGSAELGSCSSCCPGGHSGDLRVEAKSQGNKCKLVATLSTQVRGEASSTTACTLHTRLPQTRPASGGDDLDRRARRALQLVCVDLSGWTKCTRRWRNNWPHTPTPRAPRQDPSVEQRWR